MAALDFPNAPTVGQQFPAPNGAMYSWDGAVWVTQAQGQAVFIGANPPPSPPTGEMWWRSDPDQNLYIYYDDGNSKQWVNAVPTVSQPVGPAGGSLSGSYPNPGLKATAATIKSTTTQALANGVGTGLIMPTVLLDSSGGTIPATATNAVKSPGLGWVTISGFVQLSAGLTGGACGLEIDQSTDGGASFPTVVAQSEMVQGAYATQLSVAVLKDASAGMQFRLQFTNFSGAALTANLATLTLLYNGVQ